VLVHNCPADGGAAGDGITIRVVRGEGSDNPTHVPVGDMDVPGDSQWPLSASDGRLTAMTGDEYESTRPYPSGPNRFWALRDTIDNFTEGTQHPTTRARKVGAVVIKAWGAPHWPHAGEG